MARCLYNSNFATFLYTDSASIYRILDDNYHGEALTTTRDAWKAEIDIMKNVVSSLNTVDGQIIFEYDIPRLGKRIDVVLLYADHSIQFTTLLRYIDQFDFEQYIQTDPEKQRDKYTEFCLLEMQAY